MGNPFFDYLEQRAKKHGLDRLRYVAQQATQGWCRLSSNLPFYVVVNKPAPSLSKHDGERPEYWRCQDGDHVATFSPRTVQAMLDALDQLKEIAAMLTPEEQEALGLASEDRPSDEDFAEAYTAMVLWARQAIDGLEQALKGTE